ncbi:MAG TPA: alpha/beta fold hydrolase [Acidimicrobiales bacterium]|nr:alpha/beta fold hydrolase [Acidimicrobiales bacterium]
MALRTFAAGRLWGERYGSGAAWALALHGWARDHHDFDGVLQGLDAIALDLPGFGVAPEPPEPWSTREYAEYLLPVLSELCGGQGGQAVVVGHSFGARVAAQMAALSAGPEGDRQGSGALRRASISALVLAGAPLAPFAGAAHHARPPLGFRLGRVLKREGLISEAAMERFRQKYGSPDYRQASPLMRGVLVKAVQETATSAYLPLLGDWASTEGALELIWGENDTEASAAGARAALEAFPGLRPKVTLVPAAGHLLEADLISQVRQALLRNRPGSP